MRGLSLGLVAVCGGCLATSTTDPTRSDAFTQKPLTAVDILFVIDDTATMGPVQSGLAAAALTFGEPLLEVGTDARVGVVTTTVAPYGAVTDPVEAMAVGTDTSWLDGMAKAFRVGTEGSDKEKGLAAAVIALEAGFSRDATDLLVLFVSDEEDCTDDGVLDGFPPSACYTEADRLVPVASIVRDLRDHLRSDRMLRVGALVGLPGASCANYPGQRYVEAVDLAAGELADLCGDLDDAMGQFGRAATGLRTRFVLSTQARPGSLSVLVDGVEVPQDLTNGHSYDLDLAQVRFHGAAVPDFGASIVVDYVEHGYR